MGNYKLNSRGISDPEKIKKRLIMIWLQYFLSL